MIDGVCYERRVTGVGSSYAIKSVNWRAKSGMSNRLTPQVIVVIHGLAFRPGIEGFLEAV